MSAVAGDLFASSLTATPSNHKQQARVHKLNRRREQRAREATKAGHIRALTKRDNRPKVWPWDRRLIEAGYL